MPIGTLLENQTCPLYNQPTLISFDPTKCIDHLPTCASSLMNADEVMAKLEKLGSDSYKNVLVKHGAKEPFFGVKIEELKKIQKQVKVDHALALELYETGNSDAMYLAGLIADPQAFSKKDLEKWVKSAPWQMISEYTVAWVAAESRFAQELGLKWIDSPKEHIASSGWSTLSSYIAVTADEELDIAILKSLLERVKKTIHSAPNRVRYTMNAFVIAVGCYVSDLTKSCKDIGKSIGEVEVDMNGTACKVPKIVEYIAKVEKRGSIGKKRKTAMC